VILHISIWKTTGWKSEKRKKKFKGVRGFSLAPFFWWRNRNFAQNLKLYQQQQQQQQQMFTYPIGKLQSAAAWLAAGIISEVLGGIAEGPYPMVILSTPAPMPTSISPAWICAAILTTA
jgi:hypothetical protein